MTEQEVKEKLEEYGSIIELLKAEGVFAYI